jgi:MutS-like protein
LSDRLKRFARNQKILIFAVIGFAVIDSSAPFIIAPFLILQIPAVIVRARIGCKILRAYLAREFYRHAVTRFEDHWIGDGKTGEQYQGDDEAFADDLDLFGNGSLFQFLCTTRTSIGDDTLAAWLTQPADVDEILERQSAVRELSNNLDLRERLAALELGWRTFQPLAVVEWTCAPELLSSRRARVTGFALATAFAGVIFSSWSGSGPSVWIIISIVILELGFYALFRSRLQPISSHGESAVATLSYLSSMRAALQNTSFKSRRLSNIQREIAAGAVSPPSLVCAVYRFVVQLPLLLLLLCQFVPRIDRWRRSLAKPAKEGLRALGELEAIASLAQYTFFRPEATFPTLVDNETCYDATELGHPLVRASERVDNDLQLNGALQLLLVSGSNMSGKSTMLRTVGVNAVLALCGAPVCAKQLRISAFSIGTAMRFQDSLEHRTSHFYAVIARLRIVMDLQDGGRPLLFLIDEILQGTNSRDRVKGADAVVRRLIERGGVGLVTTHDLELTCIVDTLDGRAANVHFADRMVDDEIQFDYKMRPGVVETSNALALMRKMGLVV